MTECRGLRKLERGTDAAMGNEVLVTKVGGEVLVCCGKSMELLSNRGFAV